MTIPTRLTALQHWRHRSLANVFALRAAVIAIVSSLVVALISLGVIYRVEHSALKVQLQEKANRLAERVEGAIAVLESASYDLSTSSMFLTALLDSQGRKTYAAPFLDNYMFPIAASSGLALCDINGERLAGTRSPLSQCRADSPLFTQVIAQGMTLRELVPLPNGHLAWTIYQGIRFPYTNTVEGVVVTQLDLHDVLRAIPKELDLQSVGLGRADTAAPLLTLETAPTPANALGTAKARLFKGSTGVFSPFPLEAVARDHLSPFKHTLGPLVLGYGLGSLLLVLGVLYWSRRASLETVKQLTELTGIAQKIADSGDLSIRVPRIKVGEVGQLAGALEVMVSTLKTSEASLETKVAQRTEALQKSEAAAEAANLAKSRFLATMSHEIRTPMNGILGMAQMLQLPQLSPGERQDYARIILTSGQTLMTLLNDILDLSKIEAGRVQLVSSVFAPEQLLLETQALFSGAARAKKLEIEASWQGVAAQSYQADAHRLRQMLANLVGNAIKFTARGSVRLAGAEISRAGDSALLEFSVSDTGIGVAAEQLGLLFLPFSQADNSTTRQYGGTGLGLSIVHRLALLMDGTVGVESTPGQGSRFWFRFRARLCPADEAQAPAPAAAPEDAHAPRAPVPLSGRVLVAEDNPANCQVIEAMLMQLGLHPVLVNNGLEAVEAITQGAAPDLMLMDLHMPVMDGYSATGLIRQWETRSTQAHLPIIALTADAFADDRQRCLAAGMDDFLPKPIALAALAATLERWLPKAAAVTLAAAVPLKPLDVPRFMALVEEITPLLAHNKFDAITHFKALQTLGAGTAVAGEVEAIAGILGELRFDLVLARLQLLVATQVEKT